jgi:hypothetical protein
VDVVTFASGLVSFSGLDIVGGWVPVGVVTWGVSMMIPTMGEQGLVTCLEVVVGTLVALRFLESWPRTFGAGRPPLLMYGERRFWWYYICLLWPILPVYPHCLRF